MSTLRTPRSRVLPCSARALLNSRAMQTSLDAPLGLQRALLRAIDMPAREALSIARRPWPATLTPALLGAALVALCSLAALHLGPPQPAGISPRLLHADFLRAVFESLVVVVPSAAVLVSYARIPITTRALLASFSLGLFNAGVVTLAALPLIAFLGAVARAQPMISPAQLFPPLAVATLASTLARIVKSVDASRRARWTIYFINTGLFAVFTVRGLALM